MHMRARVTIVMPAAFAFRLRMFAKHSRTVREREDEERNRDEHPEDEVHEEHRP